MFLKLRPNILSNGSFNELTNLEAFHFILSKTRFSATTVYFWSYYVEFSILTRWTIISCSENKHKKNNILFIISSNLISSVYIFSIKVSICRKK